MARRCTLVNRHVRLRSTKSGNVVVAGISNQGATGEAILIIKYSASGTQQWLQTFTTAGNRHDEPTRVVFDQLGDVIVSGFVGTGDWFVAKYAGATGLQLWQRTYDNGSVDVAGCVVVDSAGDVIATGYVTATNGNDILTAKYAGADGTTIWQKQFNGPVGRSDSAHTVLVDAADDVLIVGIRSGQHSLTRISMLPNTQRPPAT
jgi:outer membrane protein assembly factor BamB